MVKAVKPKEKRARINELAEKIDVHLKRFERDPEINAPHPKYKTSSYYRAYASGYRGKVTVCYISFQGQSRLTLEEAEAYLVWLNAGNVGQHHKQQREAKEVGR